MSPEHIMDIINSIMNCGEIHSTADVKSYKTDLSKNVLMCVRKYLKIYSKKSEPCKYGFYLMMDEDGEEKLYSAQLLDRPAGGYYWEIYKVYNRFKYNPTRWKSLISTIGEYYGGCDFIILPESISKELIKIIKNV